MALIVRVGFGGILSKHKSVIGFGGILLKQES